MNKPPHRYLTVPEVADVLRLSPCTIYKLVRAKQLPVVRFAPGGRLLFDPAAVQETLGRMQEQALPAAA